MGETDLRQSVPDELRARFRSEPALGPHFHFREIALDDSGTLTLACEVASLAAKKRALSLAAAHEAVSAVVDRVQVAPAVEMGDAEIRSRLREYFTGEPAFTGFAVRLQKSFGPAGGAAPELELIAGDPASAPGEIDVEIAEGAVTLNGHVPGLASKRLAGVMSWWVPGVRDVINGLEVSPPEEDSPIAIEEAVRVVLDRDPLVDASQVRVGVRIRTVRLTGSVRSEALREIAERDAWCVFGVDEVINDIVVQP